MSTELVTHDHQMLKPSDWSRLELDYRLREQFFGEPMPADVEAMAERPLPEMV